MAAAAKSRRTLNSQVHPESSSSSRDLTRFISSSATGARGKGGGAFHRPCVADMISAFNAKSDGQDSDKGGGEDNHFDDLPRLKRTSSTGSIRVHSTDTNLSGRSHRNASVSDVKEGLSPRHEVNSSRSLGRNAFLGTTLCVDEVSSGASSPADDEGEEEEEEERAGRFTKSLGRKQIHQLNSGRISPESGRGVAPHRVRGASAESAYRPSRRRSPSPAAVPPSSPGLLSEPRPIGEPGTTSRTSTKSSRIASSPFFKFDLQKCGNVSMARPISSGPSELAQSAGRDTRRCLDSSPSPQHKSNRSSYSYSALPTSGERSRTSSTSGERSRTSSSASGRARSGSRAEQMSIQSRIKLWAEKEEEVKVKRLQMSPQHRASRLSSKSSQCSTPDLEREGASGTKAGRGVTPDLEREGASGGGASQRPVKGEDEDIYDDVVSVLAACGMPSAQLGKETEGGSAMGPVDIQISIENEDEGIYSVITVENGAPSVADGNRQEHPHPSDRPSHTTDSSHPRDEDDRMYSVIERGNVTTVPSTDPAKRDGDSKGGKKGGKGKKVKSAGKSDQPAAKQGKSKWRIRSPLTKRPKKGEGKTALEPGSTDPAVDKACKREEAEAMACEMTKTNIASRQSRNRRALKKRPLSMENSFDSVGSQREAELTHSLDSLPDDVAVENGVSVSDSEHQKRDGDIYEDIDDKRRLEVRSKSVGGVTSSASGDTLGSGQFTSQNRSQDSSAPVTDSDPVRISRGAVKGDARKDRTLSREIYDIITNLGSDDDTELFPTLHEEAAIVEATQVLLETGNLSAPAGIRSSRSDPMINRIGRRPPDSPISDPRTPANSDGNMFQFSGDSSSDSETSPANEGADLLAPIQSSLDRATCERVQLKRNRKASESSSDKEYDHTRTIVSPSVKNKYLSSPTMLRKFSLTPTYEGSESVIATDLMYADAVWDRSAMEADELNFKVGDVIEILDMTDDVWWHGCVKERSGWFPASFVRLRIGQESSEEDTEKKTDELALSLTSATRIRPLQRSHSSASVKRRMTIRRKDSAPSQPKRLTPSEVRAKVVEEILNTERDYVQQLEDIVEGYLWRCREYNQLFDTDIVETIYANVEQLLAFQRDFLAELEARIVKDRMEDSQIGEVFVINRHEFAIYSDYCNNHPHAVNEMNTLQQNDQYAFFFESCRLLRDFGLKDISLEGYLLTPVQKICKYPLQLSELLKYTDDSHPDHAHMVAAQQAMRGVAMLINEHKRRMENIGKIGLWQETIENWKGEDILGTSTELVCSGELHKISKGHSQERHFFLFDHQLIYCKKDAIGGKLSFKGRLDIDDCQITDLPDGAVNHGGNPVRNAWRMNNTAKDKWYTIYAKTAEQKKQWMDAFIRERERVREDQEKGFHIVLKMKRAAVSLASTSMETRRRRKSFNRKHGVSIDLIDSASTSLGGKKITSSLGQGNAKKGKSAKKKLQQGGSPMQSRKVS